MNLKKYFSYILLFVSFSTLAGDFRSSNWGDSISKTKTLETAELLDQVADFLTCYAKGEPCHPTFRDALETQRVCDAVLASAKSHAWSKVNG